MFRDSEQQDYLETDVDRKRKSLYFLYLFHQNYETEPVENKKKIREYYDQELRYKGAFYRDRKKFKERGNPQDWDITQTKRYKVRYEEMPYYRGMDKYTDFTYPSQNLIELELSKRLGIQLIDFQENKIILHTLYEDEINNEIDTLKSVMKIIDNKKGNFILRQYHKRRSYDLSYLRITFRFRIHDYIEFVSTNFVIPTAINKVAKSTLNKFLRNITGLTEIGEPLTKKYLDDYEQGFRLKSCLLERIYLYKRTNVVPASVSKTYLKGCDFKQTHLKSIEIIDEAP